MKYHLEINMTKGKFFFDEKEMKSTTDFIISFEDNDDLKSKMENLISRFRFIEPREPSEDWRTDYENMIEYLRGIHLVPFLFNAHVYETIYDIWAEGHIIENLFEL